VADASSASKRRFAARSEAQPSGGRTGASFPVDHDARGMVFAKAGAFDDPSWIEPQLVCWQSRELPWARIPSDLPGVPQNP